MVEEQNQSSDVNQRSGIASDCFGFSESDIVEGPRRPLFNRIRYLSTNTIRNANIDVPEVACMHRRKKVWEVPADSDVDPESPEVIYYLQPPGCYILQVILCIHNVIKAMDAEKLATSNRTIHSEDMAALSGSKTSPSSLEVVERHTIKVGAQADGRNGFTIPAKFFLGRTYQVLDGIPPQARKWFSRRHCCICWRYEGLRLGEATFSVIDLGSANGTYLNGKVLPPAGSRALQSGDLIGVSMTESGEPMLAFRFVVHSISSRVRGLDTTPQKSDFSGISDEQSLLIHQQHTNPAPSATTDCYCLDCRLDRASYTSFLNTTCTGSIVQSCSPRVVDPSCILRRSNSITDPFQSFSKTQCDSVPPTAIAKLPSTPLFPSIVDPSTFLPGRTRNSQTDLNSFSAVLTAPNATEPYSLLRRRSSVTGTIIKSGFDCQEQLINEVISTSTQLLPRLVSEGEETKRGEDDVVLQPLRKRLSEMPLGFIDVPAHREAFPYSMFIPECPLFNLITSNQINDDLLDVNREVVRIDPLLFHPAVDNSTETPDDEGRVVLFSPTSDSRKLGIKQVCKLSLTRRNRQRVKRLLKGKQLREETIVSYVDVDTIDRNLTSDVIPKVSDTTITAAIHRTHIVGHNSTRSSRRAQKHSRTRRPPTARHRRLDSDILSVEGCNIINKRTPFFSRRRIGIILSTSDRKSIDESLRRKSNEDESIRLSCVEPRNSVLDGSSTFIDCHSGLTRSCSVVIRTEQANLLNSSLASRGNMRKSPLRETWTTFRSTVARDVGGWRALFDKKTKNLVEDAEVGTSNGPVNERADGTHASSLGEGPTNPIQSCLVLPSSHEKTFDSGDTSLSIGEETFLLDRPQPFQMASLSGSAARLGGRSVPPSPSFSPSTMATSINAPTMARSYNDLPTLKSESSTSAAGNTGTHFLHGVVRRLGTRISRRRSSLPSVSDITY